MNTQAEVRICGIRIHNVTMAGAVDRMDELVARREPSYVVTPNADHIVKLQTDAEFWKIYEEAALSVADGMALLWAGSFLGTPLLEKVSGSDLMPEFCRRAAEKGYRLFLMGGREGAADGAKRELERRFPGIRIVGTYCPPMGFEKDPAQTLHIEQLVREAQPDVLFVGLGAPKQEKWIYRNHRKLGIPLCAGIGVTFEFMAGMVKRAPHWMQVAGFEWLWRLAMEPKRLWRRYLVDDPKLFWMVLQQKTGGRDFSCPKER